MGILSSLFIVFVVLLIIGGIMMFFRQDRQNFGWPEDEVVTHTTTTTTTHHEQNWDIVGMLDRQFENGQTFVIDPVDGDKVWLNSKDDLYEDGAGKIWSLR